MAKFITQYLECRNERFYTDKVHKNNPKRIGEALNIEELGGTFEGYELIQIMTDNYGHAYIILKEK